VLWRRFKAMRPVRRNAFGIAGLVIVAEVIATVHYMVPETSYALGTSSELLSAVSPQMAAKISFDKQTQSYAFNKNQKASNDETTGLAASQQAEATAYADPDKGVAVTDPITGVDFTMKPKFDMASGKRDGNRVVYPLQGNVDGWVVYSMHAVGVKEDIILTKSPGKTASFSYELQLGDGQEARLEAGGSVGIYGNSLLAGNVTTGTEKDAAILEKARKNAPKDTRLFSIPAPVVIEKDGESHVETYFELEGNRLTVKALRLDRGEYPLSIDPSIYVVTAQQFMQGNNETNVDFNVADKLIQKGKTTGARFDTWDAQAVNLPAPAWSGSAAATGGYMYQVGGTTFNGQTFTSQGPNSYVVPAGITSLTFKSWGGGGGGGAGANSTGGTGGGGGYVQSTISVTPGETLTIYVGGGGIGGTHNALGSKAGGGGGGGGYTSVYRGGTPLLIAAGGGGGGGSRDATAGGAGGGGGGTTGVNGTDIATNNASGGNGGTPSAGGTSPSSTGNDGTAGSSLNGGDGADGRSADGADGAGAAGGGASAGNGGSPNNGTTYAGGGGGGAGYFGGGGGGASSSTGGAAGGGGGGGSSYTDGGSTSVTNTAGSGINPGNSGDTGRNGAGSGGAAGLANNNGANGAGGALLITNGAGGSSVSSALSWAHLNTDTGAPEGADPGAGTCSGWCSTSAYNLPVARRDHAMVAYNGFLYVIGGTDGSTRQNTVYVAKLGANGEPRKWHPTNNDETTWTYWHTTTTLTSTRSLAGAVAYNNRLYLVGGLTGGGSGTTTTTVEYADINPMGTLGSWTTGTALTGGAVYGHSVMTYNDRLYVVGGSASFAGAPTTLTRFIKLAANGSTSGGWQTTTALPSGRMSGGGQMGTIAGGYMYISGGCGTLNASGYCTNILSDTQVASINADGSIGVWNGVGSLTSQRTGASVVSWRNQIYHIGGCSSQNTGTGDCDSAMLGTINKGEINGDGDASTVGQSSASGTGTCNAGTSSTDCDVPTSIGNMLNASIITNGYLYIVGGCTNNACSTTSGDYAYAAISSTGVTSRPAACVNGTYTNNIWCVVTANAFDLDTGLAASSPVVFNGRIYLVGGLDGGSNTNSIDRATINTDGSLSAWTRQTMTGADTGAGNQLEAQSYLFAHARANPASAGTSPGNLFIFGGCTTSSAAGCTDYGPDVHKCNIALSNGAVSGCNVSGQLQIGTIPGASSDGLGLMSGTVYANYVYLIGGVGGNLTDLDSVRYAKINDSNNVVAATGSTWAQSTQTLQNGRRRAAGFGYNGYLYVVGGFEATSGVLADIEFIKINVSDGSLDTGGFKESAVTINQRWGLSVPISNSSAYVIGGCIVGASPGGCTSRTNVVQTFQVYNNDSGAPSGYANTANTYGTNPRRMGAGSTVLNGYLYVAGGCVSTASDCTDVVNTVSYATIDPATGALGAFSNTTANLPAERGWGKLLNAGGSLYFIGGQADAAATTSSAVYYATPASGNVTSWGTATNALPAVRTKFGAAVWNDRLYVVGGLTNGGTPTTDTNTVYVSPQQSSGGDIASAWSTSTAFNVNRFGGAVTAYANNLYLMGGNDGANYLSDVQYSKIDPTTGLVGTWSYSSSLPAPIAQADAVSANGYIYLMGGRSAAATCDPVTLVAPVSANTTISSGNNPTGVGEWYETNQRYTGNRYGAAAAYSDGKIYITGGACGSGALTYVSTLADNTQQTTVLSQPQIARYSIAIDTDSDVFPNSWLLNGIDNSIGARWQLKYRSMHDLDGVVNPSEDCGTSATMPAMTTWGADTNFGNVTLGLPGVYTPKESGGGSINCARYYYFNVAVDSSQAFGYPDDVTRGPTITDLTLQFTADPSKRLMHGRTFTGGLQQPVDTPYYAN
jgi:N-acetylneuraminic acid mutarotase